LVRATPAISLPCQASPPAAGVPDLAVFRSSIARPTDTSIYASSATSRCRPQDSRPGWIRYDQDSGKRIFSRDCAEYQFTTPANDRLIVLVNHFKSKGFGSQATSNAKRKLQAQRVKAIY
jgi:hypothetical protein